MKKQVKRIEGWIGAAELIDLLWEIKNRLNGAFIYPRYSNHKRAMREIKITVEVPDVKKKKS